MNQHIITDFRRHHGKVHRHFGTGKIHHAMGADDAYHSARIGYTHRSSLSLHEAVEGLAQGDTPVAAGNFFITIYFEMLFCQSLFRFCP